MFPCTRSKLLSVLFLLLSAFPALASEKTFEVYESGSRIYLKAEPLWVPIAASGFVVAPVYMDGDIVRLENQNGSWTVEPIDFAQFKAEDPTLATHAEVNYSDVNGDALLDINVRFGNGSDQNNVDLIASGNGGFYFAKPPSEPFELPDSQVAQVPNVNPDSLPNVDSEVIGILPASFRVDESGAATYSIPIDVPKGQGGVTPSISINYNSMSGNGPLGVGWHINAVSEIQRCRRTHSDDGFVSGITLSQADALCLDGQRLVAVNGTVHGASGTEYRTKIGSKKKVVGAGVSSESNSSFSVKHEDGSTHYYSEVVTHNSSDVPYRWLLSSIIDNVGNQISFNYNEVEKINGVLGLKEKVLTSIDYSENSVEFHYSTSRMDVTDGFVLGDRYQSKALLDDIVVSNHQQQELRSYHFSYKETLSSSERSRLESVQQCDGNRFGVCLSATSFEWLDADVAIDHNYSSAIEIEDITSVSGEKFKGAKPIDFNADGFVDFGVAVQTGDTYSIALMVNTGNGFVQQGFFNVGLPPQIDGNRPIIWHPSDLDGDGIQEIVYLTTQNGVETWVAAEVYDENGSFVRTSHTLDSLDYEETSQHLLFTDADADGDQDVLYVFENSVYVSINNGGELDTAYNVELQGYGNHIPDGEALMISVRANDINKLPQLDFNGDGQIDFLMRARVTEFDRRGDVSELTSQLYVFSLEQESVGNLVLQYMDVIDNMGEFIAEANPTFLLGDVNGDGLSDALVENDGDWTCFIANGETLSKTNSCSFNLPDIEGASLVDLNGDGRSDFVYNAAQYDFFSVRYASVNESFNTDLPIYSTTEISAFSEDDTALWIDIDGDGYPGLVRIGYEDEIIVYSTDDQETPLPRDTIGSITNGFGVSTVIEYAPLTDRDVYTKGRGASNLEFGTSKVFDVISPRYVVKTVFSDAPHYGNNAAELTVQYHYEGARIQAGGRGWLGFEKVFTYDGNAGRNITTETSYHQNYPYIGMPFKTHQYVGNREDGAIFTLSEATNTYESHSLHNGKVTFPYLRTSVEDVYKVDNLGVNSTFYTQTVTTNTYEVFEDNHANLKEVEIHTFDDALSIQPLSLVKTENFYEDENIERWWLNRITKTVVTHERSSQEDAGGDPNAALSLTRTSEFSYSPVHGMLSLEELGVGEGISKHLVTLHCYDSYGNKTGKHIFSNDKAPDCSENSHLPSMDEINAVQNANNAQSFYRFEGVEFFDGRYSIGTRNAYFETQKIVADHLNKFGQPLQVEDINNIVTFYEYDAIGGIIASANSLGQIKTVQRQYKNGSHFNEPDVGNDYYFVERQQKSGTPTVFSYYDKLGRKVASAKQGFDGTYIIQQTHYDVFGRVKATTAPYYEGDDVYLTQNEYDTFDRLKFTYVIHEPNADVASSTRKTVTELKYFTDSIETIVDSNFNSEYDAVSTWKKEFRNRLGGISKVTQSGIDGDVTYAYDAADNLTEVIAVDGSVITTQFDNYGRKIGMVDPNKGSWIYTYNALGELVSQTDTRDTLTTFYRDNVGRTIKRLEFNAELSVDEATDYVFTDGNTISHLLQSEHKDDSSENSKRYFYDQYGRLRLVRTELDGIVYAQNTTYDQYGRVFQQFDADHTSDIGCDYENGILKGLCFGTHNFYNQFGYLYKKEEARYSGSDNSNNLVFFEIASNSAIDGIKALDARGNVQFSATNNGILQTRKVFDPSTGFNLSIVTRSNGTVIQDQAFAYDGLGNLRKRTNYTSSYLEEFEYDDAYRLKGTTGAHRDHYLFSGASNNNMPIATVTYSANGNILSKSDVQSNSNYYYGQSNVNSQLCGDDSFAGPNALTSLGNKRYCYDDNGNQTKEYLTDGTLVRSISYSHRNKPVSIVANGKTTSFNYDTNNKRFKRVFRDGADQTTTYYIGNVEVTTSNNGNREIKRYIPGGVSTYYTNSGVVSRQYLLEDHLGSIDTITNETGKVVEKLYFDPWGKRTRLTMTSNWNVGSRTLHADILIDSLDITPRGFTGHEHVSHADIIHMNGRIYDPTLGRFLQADPFIQAPKNSQSYNRYSYVLNNPLSYTDPSGYFFSKLFKKAFRSVIRLSVKVFGAELTNFVGNILFYKLGGPLGSAYWTYNFSRAMGASSSGALRGAFTSAASAFVFQQIGKGFNGPEGSWNVKGGPAHIAAHAVTGGIVAELQGGKFGHGFISAGLTKGAQVSGIVNMDNMYIGSLQSAIIGGTISALTGGKFGNGAQTATFQYLYNAWSSKAIKKAQEGIRILNKKLAGKVHEKTGIPFDKDGFPIFDDVAEATEEIAMTGVRSVDDALANAQAGFDKTPDGFTWHHVQDGKTMQLVPTDIHNAVAHTGGVAVIRWLNKFSTGLSVAAPYISAFDPTYYGGQMAIQGCNNGNMSMCGTATMFGAEAKPKFY